MKKCFSLLLIASLFMGLVAPGIFAGNIPEGTEGHFSDMPDDWSAPALRRAVANGLLRGAGGKIMPDSNLTRAEMAAVIVRAFGAVTAKEHKSFDDVHPDDWFAEDIAKAYQMGVMRGTGQKMNPKVPITREEAFVIFARALKLKPVPVVNRTFADIGEVSQWAAGEVHAMVNNGYVHGSNGRLNPKGLITRAEFCQLLDNLIKQHIKTGGIITSVADGNILVSVPGVHMKNLTVNGDLIIGDGVGEGDFTLEDVKIKGRLVVRGGGKNSIIIRGNSEVSEVILCRSEGAVSVRVMDGSDVEVVYINDGSDDVYLEGNVGTVSIEADDLLVTARNANIGAMNIQCSKTRVIVDKNSAVVTILVKNKAEGNEIDVAGKVSDITTAGKGTLITGTGRISAVNVQAGGNDTTVGSAGTKITVGYGVTAVFCGGTKIEQGTTVMTNPQGTGIITPTPFPLVTPKPSNPSPSPTLSPTPTPTASPLPPGGGVSGGGGNNNPPSGGTGGGGPNNPPGGGSGDERIRVDSVTVQPSSMTLKVGQTVSISASVKPDNATDKKVSWFSSNVQAATINSNGVVTALAPGSTTITATTNDGGKTASCTVNVTQKEPAADMSALESTIALASNKKRRASIGNAVGQHSQEAVSELERSMESAQAILQNDGSTQAQVDAAANALKEAIHAFDFSMIIPPDTYVLSVFSLPEEGAVTVSEAVYAQDEMAATDAKYYPAGCSISIMAAPSGGYYFAGWQIEGIEASDNPYVFTMPENHVAVTANFLKNKEYDTFILRKDAAFNVRLAEDIYWVPVNTLGAPEHCSDEIKEMIARGDPQYIKNNINTLYDAIQYYYLSSYRILRRGEHKDINIGGVYWQTHKSGVEALMTNEGDCSGLSALLRYLLEGDYDDVGYLAYNLPNGAGHVFNYIKEGGTYYFIDLYGIEDAFVETGDTPADRYFGSNLVKAPSIQKYAEFYRSRYFSGIALFNSHSTERVSPIGFKDGTYYFPDNIQFVFYPTEVNVPRVICKGPAATTVWAYGDLPVIEPVTAADIEILTAPNYAFYASTKMFTGTLCFSLKRHGSAEMKSITLDYYTPQNEWIRQESIQKEQISRANTNSFLFDRRYYFLPQSNAPVIIKGKAYFKDIRNREFMVGFTMDYTQMQHHIDQGIKPAGEVIPSQYDREKLKYNACYKMPVGNGVFWVPVNTLGKPQLTGEQIRAVPKTPQALKQEINTLYDAIAFVQEYDMSGEDRRFLSHDNTLWEYYHPIQHTVSSNLGGCGLMSDLLHYLLQDDYDEVGYVVYSLSNGEYEIQNFILENGKYYIINLDSYLNGDNRLVPETGSYWDLPGHPIAGCLFEADSLQCFAEYFRATTGMVPEFIAAYTDDAISSMGRKPDRDRTRIFFPEKLRQKLIILYDNPDDCVSYDFTRLPF